MTSSFTDSAYIPQPSRLAWVPHGPRAAETEKENQMVLLLAQLSPERRGLMAYRDAADHPAGADLLVDLMAGYRSADASFIGASGLLEAATADTGTLGDVTRARAARRFVTAGLARERTLGALRAEGLKRK